MNFGVLHWTPLESEEERGKKGSRAVSSDFEGLDI